MSKLEHALSGLAPKLTPQWSVDRAKAVERAMALTRRRRQLTARLGLAAAVTSTLLIALVSLLRSQSVAEPRAELSSMANVGFVTAEPPAATNPLQASISRIDSHTTLELLSLDDRETHVALKAGGAWFDLAPATTARSMAVNVGEVEVSFRATRVLVEQLAHGARVMVERGETEVRWASGRAHLHAGEAGVFPPPQAPPMPPLIAPEPNAEEWSPYRAPTVARPKAPATITRPAAVVEPTPDIPSPITPRDLRDAPTRLLDEADSARASGQPEQAVPPLRTLLERYPNDPLAPVAAFTLGRVLLENLHRPQEAADAFAAVRQLAPNSVLFEDALAREVEAADKAGDSRRATLLAVDYLARFPAGARVKAVREYGGLK